MDIEKSNFGLAGLNVMITGASSGIGRECAIQCSRYGANVVLIGRNRDRLEQTLSLLKPGSHLSYAADISDYVNIQNIVRDSVDKLGAMAGFIHSAGIGGTFPIHLTKPEIYEREFRINVISGFEFVRLLSKKGSYPETGASYVFISSVMSVVGEGLKTAYCSSKGALISGVRSMAMELGRKKIRVNAISPGIIDTEMNDRYEDKVPANAMENMLKNQVLGLGKPTDVALACVYLISRAASFVTGTNMIVDGGYTAH